MKFWRIILVFFLAASVLSNNALSQCGLNSCQDCLDKYDECRWCTSSIRIGYCEDRTTVATCAVTDPLPDIIRYVQLFGVQPTLEFQEYVLDPVDPGSVCLLESEAFVWLWEKTTCQSCLMDINQDWCIVTSVEITGGVCLRAQDPNINLCQSLSGSDNIDFRLINSIGECCTDLRCDRCNLNSGCTWCTSFIQDVADSLLGYCMIGGEGASCGVDKFSKLTNMMTLLGDEAPIISWKPRNSPCNANDVYYDPVDKQCTNCIDDGGIYNILKSTTGAAAVGICDADSSSSSSSSSWINTINVASSISFLTSSVSTSTSCPADNFCDNIKNCADCRNYPGCVWCGIKFKLGSNNWGTHFGKCVSISSSNPCTLHEYFGTAEVLPLSISHGWTNVDTNCSDTTIDLIAHNTCQYCINDGGVFCLPTSVGIIGGVCLRAQDFNIDICRKIIAHETFHIHVIELKVFTDQCSLIHHTSLGKLVVLLVVCIFLFLLVLLYYASVALRSPTEPLTTGVKLAISEKAYAPSSVIWDIPAKEYEL